MMMTMMRIMMTDVSNVSQCLNANKIHFKQYTADTVSLHHYVIWPGGFLQLLIKEQPFPVF
jgi:hypothetical protein